MEKSIVIDIAKDGTILMEGKNFEGMECDHAMAAFEQGLGVVTDRTNKPEYRSGEGESERVLSRR